MERIIRIILMALFSTNLLVGLWVGLLSNNMIFLGANSVVSVVAVVLFSNKGVLRRLNLLGVQADFDPLSEAELNLLRQLASKNVTDLTDKHDPEIVRLLERYTKTTTQKTKKKADLSYEDFALQGASDFRSGNFEAARDNWLEASKIKADDGDLLIKLGDAFFRLGDFEKALQSYKKGSEINDRNHLAYVGIGNCQTKKSHFPEAKDAYRRALVIKDDCHLALTGMGNLHYIKSDLKAAKGFYKKAIECNPHYALPYMNFVEASIILGDYVDAKNELLTFTVIWHKDLSKIAIGFVLVGILTIVEGRDSHEIKVTLGRLIDENDFQVTFDFSSLRAWADSSFSGRHESDQIQDLISIIDKKKVAR